MRRTHLLLLAIVSLAVMPHDLSACRFARRHRQCPIVAAPQTPADAIHQVLDAQVVAWNRGDLEGFMAGYWNSPDLTFQSGDTVTRGWQPTLDRYRARYQGEGKEMGTLTFSDMEITILDADNATVRGKWKLVKTKESLGGRFTLTFKRFPEGWRIVHDHTTG